MNPILDTVGDIGFTLATVGANLFVILYSILARFWRTESGLHIFSFMLVVALIMDNAAVLLNFGPYPGALWVRAVLYPALGTVIFWRVFILVRVQVAYRRQRVSSATNAP